jgi:ABC-type sulfate/molybdate transport systems ATPase subunit
MQFGLQLNSQHPASENMRERLQELLEQVHLAQAKAGIGSDHSRR